jgi:hypothetical protein
MAMLRRLAVGLAAIGALVAVPSSASAAIESALTRSSTAGIRSAST